MQLLPEDKSVFQSHTSHPRYIHVRLIFIYLRSKSLTVLTCWTASIDDYSAFAFAPLILHAATRAALTRPVSRGQDCRAPAIECLDFVLQESSFRKASCLSDRDVNALRGQTFALCDLP